MRNVFAFIAGGRKSLSVFGDVSRFTLNRIAPSILENLAITSFQTFAVLHRGYPCVEDTMIEVENIHGRTGL